MTAAEAIRVAMDARPGFDVPDSFQPLTAEKRIVELVEPTQPVRDQMPKPGRTRDVIAWVVTLGAEAAEVWFTVRDSSGDIVRFHKSRNAALVMGQRETEA